jgi:hypothetical protein
MRDVDHRGAKLGVKFRELKPHLHPQLGVEVGERLVEQENLGLAHKCSADRDPLTLAARKLCWPSIERGLELQDPRDLERALVLSRFRLPGDRLAAAGWAEQRGERAFLHRETEIGDGCDRAVALRHPP